MGNMDYNLEISKLQSQARVMKVLAKIAVVSSLITILILVFGFALPDSIIFMIILMIPVSIIVSNNAVDKYFRTRIEYLVNENLVQTLEDNDDYETSDLTNQNSKPRDFEHLRNRPSDEKGPAFGLEQKPFSTKNKRVDALKNRDYDDIESVSTSGEEMLRLADKINADSAAEEWEKSQSNDQDLIEAGVENLGDLIKTGWFEKNKQESAVKRLYGDKEGNQI